MASRQTPRTGAAQQPQTPGARAQRVLAGMAITVVGLTVIAIVANFVLHALLAPSAFTGGALAFIAVFPLPGLAIGLLLMVAAVTVTAVNRAKAQRPPR